MWDQKLAGSGPFYPFSPNHTEVDSHRRWCAGPYSNPNTHQKKHEWSFKVCVCVCVCARVLVRVRVRVRARARLRACACTRVRVQVVNGYARGSAGRCCSCR